MSDKKEIKGRWFILIPIILYALFMLWGYFPMFFYSFIIVVFLATTIFENIYIYEQFYKPYISEKRYFEKYVKKYVTDDRYYRENGEEQKYIEHLSLLKTKCDEFKYYYIGFWSQMFYDYIILPPCNGINYLLNKFVKVCIYVDEKLTVKI